MISRQNLLLLVLVVCIAVVPLVFFGDSEFGGADNKVADVVGEMRPDHQPWFESLWKPQSSEVESLLFALQAALGAGVIGYFFGYMRGRETGARS